MGVGIQFLKFGWTNAEKSRTKMQRIQRWLINISSCSLTNLLQIACLLQVKQVRYKNEKNAEKYWKDVTDIKNYGSKYVGVSDTDVNLDNNAVAENAW